MLLPPRLHTEDGGSKGGKRAFSVSLSLSVCMSLSLSLSVSLCLYLSLGKESHFSSILQWHLFPTHTHTHTPRHTFTQTHTHSHTNTNRHTHTETYTHTPGRHTPTLTHTNTQLPACSTQLPAGCDRAEHLLLCIFLTQRY